MDQSQDLKTYKLKEIDNYQLDPYRSKLSIENVQRTVPPPLPPIPKDYVLVATGFGAGHGVGMSQWGAKAMAEKGASFSKILKHYYTGVQIKTY